MSVEAIAWAFTVDIKPSSAKFVLVAMANNASTENMLAWPSIKHLSDATGQDRKTVLANIAILRESGLIEDTGRRTGATKQIIVYRLNRPKNGIVKQDQERDCPEAEQSQERDASKGETVPFFPPNSPNIPSKQSQKRDTEPSGTVKEPEEKISRRAKGSRFCPDDFQPDDDLLDWARREHPSIDPRRQTDAFRDHEFAKPITDWRRAWRRWIRNAETFSRTAAPRKGAPSRRETTAEHNDRAFDEWMAGTDDGRTIDA